jgi:hypothetical protein
MQVHVKRAEGYTRQPITNFANDPFGVSGAFSEVEVQARLQKQLTGAQTGSEAAGVCRQIWMGIMELCGYRPMKMDGWMGSRSRWKKLKCTSGYQPRILTKRDVDVFYGNCTDRMPIGRVGNIGCAF